MERRVPEQLETQRLLLRQFREEDWGDLHAYCSSTEATRFTFGRELTEGDTWRALCSMLGHWQLRGYGPYALEEKEASKVIGVCGFWFPNDWPEPEIKWALAPEFWGRGYASEAARAVQSAGREHLPEVHLISLIHSENEPSKRLATAIGATFSRVHRFRGADYHIFRHPTG
ncbi:MAG: GNAT family N-acetyltransferase [Pseudomonadota bacterium]